MTSFGVWWRSAARPPLLGRGSRHWTYAAGHPVLTLEVEDYIRGANRLTVDTLEIEGSAKLTWPTLRQALEPLGLKNSIRLIVIRRAESVPDHVWNGLAVWEASFGRRRRNMIPSCNILATGIEPWNARDIHDPRHSIFVASPWGQYVECKPLSEEGMARYVVGRFVRAGRGSVLPADFAPVIVERCGHDLLRLRSAVTLLLAALPPGRLLTPEILDLVVSPTPGERFVEALVSGDRRAALSRASQVGNVRFVLGALEYQCAALFLIRLVLRQRGRVSTRDLATHTNLDPFVVRKLRPFASSYSGPVVRRRYGLLLAASMRLMRTAVPADRPDWVLVPLASAW